MERMPRTAGVNASGRTERGGRGEVDGGGKCAEGVLLVIGANLNLPFARRSLY